MFKKGCIPWNKGKKLPQLSKAHKGKKLSDEHKESISKGLIGKKRKTFSEEHRKNMGLASKGRPSAMGMLGKKHTKETRKKMSKSQKSGENHHSWKGGLTRTNRTIRFSFEYKLWRKAVFERDNFTCQKYGSRGGKLHAHHINNFAEKEELRFAIDNGVTLSEKAHKEFHKKYSNRNNTEEQLIEFLNI